MSSHPVRDSLLGMFVLGLGVGALLTSPSTGSPSIRPRTRYLPAPRAHRRRRFVVPAMTALAFLLAYLQFGLSWRLLEACAFICVMIVIAFIDLDYMIIPNVIVLPAALVGLAASIALDPARWWVYLVAAVGSFAVSVRARPDLAWRDGNG